MASQVVGASGGGPCFSVILGSKSSIVPEDDASALVQPTITHLHQLTRPGVSPRNTRDFGQIPSGGEYYISGAGGFPGDEDPISAQAQQPLDQWLGQETLDPILDAQIPLLIQSIIDEGSLVSSISSGTDAGFKDKRLSQFRQLIHWLHILAVIETSSLTEQRSGLREKPELLNKSYFRFKADSGLISVEIELRIRIIESIELILEVVESEQLMALATEADLVEMLVIANRFHPNLAEIANASDRRILRLSMIPFHIDNLILSRLVPSPNASAWKGPFDLLGVDSALVQELILERLVPSVKAVYFYEISKPHSEQGELHLEKWIIFRGHLSMPFSMAEASSRVQAQGGELGIDRSKNGATAKEFLIRVDAGLTIAYELLELLKEQALSFRSSPDQETAPFLIFQALITLDVVVKGLNAPPDLIAHLQQLAAPIDPNNSRLGLPKEFERLRLFGNMSKILRSLLEESVIQTAVRRIDGLNLRRIAALFDALAAMPELIAAQSKTKFVN